MRRFILLAALAVGVFPLASDAGFTPNAHVILFTDYGADSIYVGILKGSIYSKYMPARVDSITTSVPPYDIETGAYLLAESCKEFPRGTVFCCIVDPGVGTERKPIALRTKREQVFVAPDNGLLTLVAARDGIFEAHEITNASLYREGGGAHPPARTDSTDAPPAERVSHTFQGRDIFGPVAAAVAEGTPLREIGPEIADITRLPIEPCRAENGAMHGKVFRTDDYGNMVLNMTERELMTLGLKPGDTVDVSIGTTRFTAPWKPTYAGVPVGEKVLVIQSSGYVECAVNKGSLAAAIKEGVHAEAVIRKP
ncbi:MAG: SAM-dependent chlorinase/fluorinase [Candidatus Hydrogenedentes bacterium]|nr:SAM-dependent chlorinase/fluorinase [Candidatus Hydrogenedentota bacterium]